MPALQYIDRPNWGSALGDFGSAALGEVSKTMEINNKNDAMKQALANAKKIRDEGGSEEDAVAELVGVPGLDLNETKTLTGIFSDIGVKREKRETKAKKDEMDQKNFELREKKFQHDIDKVDKKDQQNYIKDIGSYQVGENVLDSMSALVEKGNLGVTSRMDPRDQTLADIAEWEITSKKMVNFVLSGVVIRNKHEFLAAANRLTDPYTRDATKRGIIKGLRKTLKEEIDIVNQKYQKGKYSGEGGQEAPQQQPQAPPTRSREEIMANIKKKRGY